MSFHVFNALLCSPLCIKRCPAFVNTFNHSHKFVQLRLALNPATFTNNDVVFLDSLSSKLSHANRVTRLGGFSPFGCLFTLGRYKKITTQPSFWASFSSVKIMH
jgi:hypothetical protein